MFEKSFWQCASQHCTFVGIVSQSQTHIWQNAFCKHALAVPNV